MNNTHEDRSKQPQDTRHRGEDSPHQHPLPEYFDSAASTWDNDPSKLAHAGRVATLIREHVPLRETWTALDFGAGSGQLSHELAPLLGHIDLVDAAEGMTRVAAQKFVDNPDVSVHHLDVLSTPNADVPDGDFPHSAYDLIYASMSLHHVADPDAALRAFRRASHPVGHVQTHGTWLAIAELGPDPEQHFHAHRPGFHGHHGFTTEELRAALERSGFALQQVLPAGEIMKERDGVGRFFPVSLFIARAAPHD